MFKYNICRAATATAALMKKDRETIDLPKKDSRFVHDFEFSPTRPIHVKSTEYVFRRKHPIHPLILKNDWAFNVNMAAETKEIRLYDHRILNAETLALIGKVPCDRKFLRYQYLANVLKGISLTGITSLNKEKFIGGISKHDFFSFNQKMSKPVNNVREIITLACELITSVKLAIDFLSIFRNIPVQKKVLEKWISAIKIGIDLMRLMYRLYKNHFVSEDNEVDGQNPLNHDDITFVFEVGYSILTVLEIIIYARNKDGTEKNDK